MARNIDRELLEAALLGFEHKKSEIDQHISALRRRLGGRVVQASSDGAVPGKARKRRTLSPAARKRIAAAQKKRWAAWKKAHKTAAR